MIGETFGNYRVTQLIGEGGMGVVYLAEHPGIGRRAAVKVLRPGLTDNAEITKRFFNEARAANAIRHPGIVEVFDCGTLPSGTSYIVMELLEGENLAGRLRNVGRLPIADARRFVAQTASALSAAHAAGIVHRDLKPDNLFLVPDDRDASSEMVKVLDFGIAKLGLLGQQGSNVSSVRTRTGSVMGTPAYMSPEQCRGTREIDHRTDIYALGVILYEMVCGRPPFVSEGFGEMVHLHISAPPPPPRTIDASIPPELERLILWCLEKEPADRVQTMADLHAALTGRPTPARVTARPQPQRPQQPATPTTFSQAAHARDLATDVSPRAGGRKAPIVVLAALAIAGLVVWQTRGSWTPRRADTVTVAPATATPASPSAAAPAEATPATAAPATVTVTAALVSEPSGARVVREKDGAVIGMTPFRETWPSGGGVMKLRLELDGYRAQSVAVPLDRGVDLAFTMQKVAAADAPKHKDAKHAPAHAPVPKTPRPSAAPRPPAKSEPVPL